MLRAPRPRAGLTLPELLVLFVLAFFSVTLFLPAAEVAKQNAAKNECANNLRMLVLASANCHDKHGRFPPLVGDFPNEKAHGTLFYHILPFLDQDKVYTKGQGEKDRFSVWTNGVYSQVIKPFLCPADTSGGPDNRFEVWLAQTSYAANFQVFGDPIENTMQGHARYGTVTDGASNTIFFAERYQTCNGTPNAWGFAGESTTAPAFGYLTLAKFQDQPAQKDCDATRTQAIHVGGIHVGMGDGSTRFIAPNISPRTWSLAVIPDDGLPLGGGTSTDW